MRGSIVKRGTSYSIVYRAPDPTTGVVKQVWRGGFPARRAAEAELKAVVATIDAGTYAAPTAMTVRQFVDGTWLPGLEAGDLRPSTVLMYRRSVQRHVLPYVGGLQLRHVRPVHLTAMLTELKGTGLGDRSVEIAGVTVHKMLKSAMDLELIVRNPADNSAVREARPRVKAPQPAIWSAAETRDFLDTQRDHRLFPLWRLAAMSGLRRGELAGLKWTDVDLEAGTLRVNASRVVVHGKVLVSAPKTAKSARTIALDPGTVTALKAHRRGSSRNGWPLARPGSTAASCSLRKLARASTRHG